MNLTSKEVHLFQTSPPLAFDVLSPCQFLELWSLFLAPDSLSYCPVSWLIEGQKNMLDATAAVEGRG